MELIKTESEEEQAALSEPEPRYKPASLPASRPSRGRAGLRTLAVLLLAIILVVLIVLLARWIYHKSHHAVQPAPATSQQSPAGASNKSASGAKNANNSAGSAGNSASNPPGSTTPSGSKTNSPQLSNTGPGNVAAVFAAAAIAAGGLHYIISVRRFAKNS